MKNRKVLLLMAMLSMVFTVIIPTSIYALDPETNQETGETTHLVKNLHQALVQAKAQLPKLYL